MSRYRIGRIDLPWLNFTPPIRGGLFRQLGDDDDDTTSSSSSETEEEDVDFNLGSINSSSTSVDTIKSAIAPAAEASIYSIKGNSIEKLRRPFPSQVDPEPCEHGVSATATCASKIEVYQQSSDSYVTSSVQQEIDDNIRDYPSLDAATQRNITLKYRALHRRVRDEGFYDCRYGEYAKEVVRYATLLSIFFVALRYEWYMTSAAFLGLFWVSYSGCIL